MDIGGVKMKSILLVRTIGANYGGIEGQIIQIARGLVTREVLSPILATSNKSSLLAHAFEAIGLPVYEIPTTKVFAGANAIEQILQKHHVSIIQSHRFHESLACRLVKMRHPEMRHVCRVHTHIDSSSIPEWRKIGYHLLDRLSSQWVDLYVPISKIVYEELNKRTGISPAKLCMVRDGIAPIGVEEQCNDSREKPLPARVAMVANLMPNKGCDVLIDSLAILAKWKLIVTARLIGGEANESIEIDAKGYKEKLLAMAEQKGVTRQLDFYGYAKDVAGSLQGYPVVVLPSNKEGTPNCLIEAMSLRKLVVASDVGGIPEIVHDRKNGLLHPARDPKALAEILKDVFTSPSRKWESLRNAGYETWRTEFSADTMMEGLIKVYRELGGM